MRQEENGISNGRRNYSRYASLTSSARIEWELTFESGAQAAAFGKSFLEVYNPNEFVQTTKHVRILNAVRDYKIGLPLTIDQFVVLPPLSLTLLSSYLSPPFQIERKTIGTPHLSTKLSQSTFTLSPNLDVSQPEPFPRHSSLGTTTNLVLLPLERSNFIRSPKNR